MSASAKVIQADLRRISNPKDAEFLQRFFKTGEGQYGHGDRFRGIRDEALRERIYKAYLSNSDRINNWDLEVANRDGEAARKFLRSHYSKMPRTMLRYAIEKFPEAERQSYLKGTA